MSVGLAQNTGAGASGGRGLSPAIWGDCPLIGGAPVMDPNDGIIVWEDFVSGGLITSPTTSAALVGLPLSGFGSSGSTITYGTDPEGSVVLTEATNDEGGSIFSLVYPFQISAHKKGLWFEARIKTSTITANQQGFFVGLADSTAKTATVPLTATTALADLNLVGFHKPEANTTTFNFSYKADGYDAVPVSTGIGTLAANTWIKLGFKYIPDYGGSAKLFSFVDGVQQADSTTIPNNTGTSFPADTKLGPIVAHLLGASSSNTITVDWWCVAQLL